MFMSPRRRMLTFLLGGCTVAALTVAACTDNTVDMPQGSHGTVPVDAASDAQNAETGADGSSDTGADAIVDSSASDAHLDAGDAGDG